MGGSRAQLYKPHKSRFSTKSSRNLHKTSFQGKSSSWIDLDSEDETFRMDSGTTLKQEIAWANHLSIQSWLGILLVKTNDDVMDANSTSSIDFWELWISFCLCEHHGQLHLIFFFPNK